MNALRVDLGMTVELVIKLSAAEIEVKRQQAISGQQACIEADGKRVGYIDGYGGFVSLNPHVRRAFVDYDNALACYGLELYMERKDSAPAIKPVTPIELDYGDDEDEVDDDRFKPIAQKPKSDRVKKKKESNGTRG